jgi:uncharacterized protein YxeA
MRKTLPILVSLLFLIALSASAQINRDQARSLLQTTLKSRGDKVAKKQIEETTNNVSGYYTFGAYQQSQGVQNVVGWFAVNKRTGQVWETTTCELYQFPALEKQRRKLVRHATKSKQKPPCADGQRAHIVRKPPSRRSAELPEVAQ